MRPLSLALALSTAACSAGDSATTLATPVRTTNLGGSTNGLYGEGPLFVLTEAERHEGRDLNGDGDAFDDVVSILDSETAGDLNGDGDRLDTVAHVLDLRSGRLTNLGLATALAFPLNGPVSLLLVSEAGEGRDLNDDGDAEDGVLHRLRLGP